MSEFVRLLQLIVAKLYAFLFRHPFAALASAVFLLAVIILPQQIAALTERRITVLVGPKSGSSDRRVREIIKYLQTHPGAAYWSRRYVLTSEATQGYEENRRRVNEDDTGTVIGFSHDGFTSAHNVRTMFPLTDSYLHIFINKSISPGSMKRTIEKVIVPNREKLKGKVYLGPDQSGTRQLAQLVLKHYGLKPEELEKAGTGAWEWNDAASELIDGNILMFFWVTPIEPNSRVIARLGDSGKCCMIGMENIDGIRIGSPFLLSRTFPKTSYSASSDLCNDELHTIASKNVIICSSAMSDTDAYFLAGIVREALRGEIPEIQWGRTSPQQIESDALTFYLHPGAKLLKDGQTPGWLSGLRWLWVFIVSPILLMALIDGAKLLSDRWGPSNAAPAPDVVSPPPPTPSKAASDSKSSIEDVGDTTSDPHSPREKLNAALEDARRILLTSSRSVEDRIAAIQILSRHLDEYREAGPALVETIADETAPTILRLEAIYFMEACPRWEPSFEPLLTRAKQSPPAEIAKRVEALTRKLKKKSASSTT